MDSTNIVVHTDNICNIVAKNKIELDENYRNYLNIGEEAKHVKFNYKKVGQPTLGKGKKCAKERKKAGLHPKGIKKPLKWLRKKKQ